MEFKKKNDNKLNARDLITLGIFNAIAMVVYMLVSSLFCMTILGSLIATAAVYLVIGVVYLLPAIKIRKRGVFLISGLILAIVSLASGQVYHLISVIIGGIIAELFAGDYSTSKKISSAFVDLMTFDFIGINLPIFAFGPSYILERGARFGITEAAINSSLKYFTWSTFIILLVLNIVCAIVGAWIGMKIIKKHFKESDLIE